MVQKNVSLIGTPLSFPAAKGSPKFNLELPVCPTRPRSGGSHLFTLQVFKKLLLYTPDIVQVVGMYVCPHRDYIHLGGESGITYNQLVKQIICSKAVCSMKGKQRWGRAIGMRRQRGATGCSFKKGLSAGVIRQTMGGTGAGVRGKGNDQSKGPRAGVCPAFSRTARVP